MIRQLKDKLYYYAVTKNDNIRYEYERYVKEHIEDHGTKRLQHWLILIKLNKHYRIFQKNTPLFYHPASIKNTKMAYIEGAESERYKRPNESTFVNQLSPYDVISFDIFDTLILRPFSEPQDLFMILGYKFGIMDFYDIRKQSERQARQNHQENYGNSEITIYDIYKIIEKKTGIKSEIGVKKEFETELEFCHANPYMVRVFKMLKAQGKKIIATSDMYFPKVMIKELLRNCGYQGFDEIFISCDYEHSKRDGELYEIVKEQFGTEHQYAHIGDNYASDIQNAEAHNIKPFFYRNVHNLGNPYRCDGMSELVGAAYRGLINTHLYNGTKSYSVPYEYGFVYGGLYVLGYCNWIHKYAKLHNIDKVLFLSRDGDIYRKIFNNLFNDVDNEYVYWSRIANIKYVSEAFKDDFIKRMVIHRSGNVIKMSLKTLLESLDLSSLSSQLSNYNLSEEDLIIPENVDSIINFFTDNWETVLLLLDRNASSVKKYLLGVIDGCKHIAIVDVGWQGTGPLGIKHLIQSKWKIDCKVDCLLAVNRIFSHKGNLDTLMNEDVVPYIFSRMYNRNLYDTHAKTNKNTNNIYFELFTQATSPSFAGWSKNEDFLFEIPEVENYHTMAEIHRGIEDFCTNYAEIFKNYPFMLNIAGYDAYLPFRFIIRNLSYFRKFFGDFKYSRSVLSDKTIQTLESLNDIMDKANV